MDVYSSEFDYVRIFYVSLLYGGIVFGTGYTIKVAGDARTEIGKWFYHKMGITLMSAEPRDY